MQPRSEKPHAKDVTPRRRASYVNSAKDVTIPKIHRPSVPEKEIYDPIESSGSSSDDRDPCETYAVAKETSILENGEAGGIAKITTEKEGEKNENSEPKNAVLSSKKRTLIIGGTAREEIDFSESNPFAGGPENNNPFRKENSNNVSSMTSFANSTVKDDTPNFGSGGNQQNARSSKAAGSIPLLSRGTVPSSPSQQRGPHPASATTRTPQKQPLGGDRTKGRTNRPVHVPDHQKGNEEGASNPSAKKNPQTESKGDNLRAEEEEEEEEEEGEGGNERFTLPQTQDSTLDDLPFPSTLKKRGRSATAPSAVGKEKTETESLSLVNVSKKAKGVRRSQKAGLFIPVGEVHTLFGHANPGGLISDYGAIALASLIEQTTGRLTSSSLNEALYTEHKKTVTEDDISAALKNDPFFSWKKDLVVFSFDNGMHHAPKTVKEIAAVKKEKKKASKALKDKKKTEAKNMGDAIRRTREVLSAMVLERKRLSSSTRVTKSRQSKPSAKTLNVSRGAGGARKKETQQPPKKRTTNSKKAATTNEESKTSSSEEERDLTSSSDEGGEEEKPASFSEEEEEEEEEAYETEIKKGNGGKRKRNPQSKGNQKGKKRRA